MLERARRVGSRLTCLARRGQRGADPRQASLTRQG